MKEIMVLVFASLTGCSGIQLTAQQSKCIADAENEASEAALAYCEDHWDTCSHAPSIRNDFREDVNACLGVE